MEAYSNVPNGTYDDRRAGARISVFCGRVTAVWDQAHFDKMPLGTFPDLNDAIAAQEKA